MAWKSKKTRGDLVHVFLPSASQRSGFPNFTPPLNVNPGGELWTDFDEKIVFGDGMEYVGDCEVDAKNSRLLVRAPPNSRTVAFHHGFCGHLRWKAIFGCAPQSGAYESIGFSNPQWNDCVAVFIEGDKFYFITKYMYDFYKTELTWDPDYAVGYHTYDIYWLPHRVDLYIDSVWKATHYPPYNPQIPLNVDFTNRDNIGEVTQQIIGEVRLVGYILNPMPVSQFFDFAESATRTADGQSAVKDVSTFHEAVVFLDVTDVAGTDRALWVTLMVNDGTRDYPFYEFPKVTNPVQLLKQVEVFGGKLRVAWKIAGGSPSFTFRCSLYGKP